MSSDCICPIDLQRLSPESTPESVVPTVLVPHEDNGGAGWHRMLCPVAKRFENRQRAAQRAPIVPPLGRTSYVDAPVSIVVGAPTQALIDSVMAEVRRVALKYGVPREQLDRCVNDFAHALAPHAGHKLSPGKSPSHYKRWFQGWARGYWAARDAQRAEAASEASARVP
jgi:hypothetical protein